MEEKSTKVNLILHLFTVICWIIVLVINLNTNKNPVLITLDFICVALYSFLLVTDIIDYKKIHHLERK